MRYMVTKEIESETQVVWFLYFQEPGISDRVDCDDNASAGAGAHFPESVLLVVLSRDGSRFSPPMRQKSKTAQLPEYRAVIYAAKTCIQLRTDL